jgi:hypothetical protein
MKLVLRLTHIVVVLSLLLLPLASLPQMANAQESSPTPIATPSDASATTGPAPVAPAPTPTPGPQPQGDPTLTPAPRQLDRPAGAFETSPQPAMTAEEEAARFSADFSGVLAQLSLEYTSYTYTHSDILLFSYNNSTNFEVYYSGGALLWSGTLNAGQHRSLTPGAGVYLVAASQPFSVNVGDALSDYVWGYYAIDQYGQGLSTLLHTWQAAWDNSTYDPHFVVFAYQDNTDIEVRNSTSQALIWSGRLNEGQHYDNTQLSGMFLTVSASKPVSALSYTDQGYYVPASNGTFTGNKFYTFVGNSGSWTEDLNLVAYESTSIDVFDTSTGAPLWSGVLNPGQVSSIPGLNGRYITVQSSGRIAVSVSPFASYSDGYYYHSIYAQDSSGTGIGSQFFVPTIPHNSTVTCRLIIFSYTDNNAVRVQTTSGQTVFDGTLSQAAVQTIYPEFTVYTITGSGELSALLDCGDRAGAAFAPVHYGVVQVQIEAPVTGASYYYGSTVDIRARVTKQGVPLLGANVQARIQLSTGYLETQLNDLGLAGDAAIFDGVYSAHLTLPLPPLMSAGNYYLYVNATKEGEGASSAGSSSTLFSVAGPASGSLTVTPSLTCPGGSQIVRNDTCTLSATVGYPDGSVRQGQATRLILLAPNDQQTIVALAYQGQNQWQAPVTFDRSGRYLLDLRADPPTGVSYISGYAGLQADVLEAAGNLAITIDNLPGSMTQNQLAQWLVRVTAAGQPLASASVTAQVQPGGTLVDFVSLGDGRYSAMYSAETAGSFAINLTATSPVYKPGSASLALTVGSAGSDLLGAVNAVKAFTDSELTTMDQYVEQTASDGDWFWNQIPADRFQKYFHVLVNVISLGVSTAGLSDELAKMAGQSVAPVASRFPGLGPMAWLRKYGLGNDGRVWQSWATRLSNSVSSGLFETYLLQRRFPPYIGAGVLERAGVFYLSKLLAEPIDSVIIKGVGDNLARLRLDSSTFLRGTLYPIFLQSVTEDRQLVFDLANNVLSQPPSLPGNTSAALASSLTSRMQANSYLVRDMQQRNRTIWTTQDRREQEVNAPWYEGFSVALFKAALPLVVGFALGGPVGLSVGVIIGIGEVVVGTETLIEDFIRDNANLTTDERMHELAYGSMFTNMETKETVVQNSLSGLAEVREATVVGSGFQPGVVPKGLLMRVDQVSRCNYFVFCWEKEALSRVTIKNTGTIKADYVLRAYYDRIGSWGSETDAFWLDSMRDPVSGETIGWVTLEPNQTKVVEVAYKNADTGLDMRPNNGADITLVLASVTLNGFYYSDARLDYFTPTEEPLNGQMVEAAELAASATLPYPLSTQVASGPGERDSTITIQVQNPFPYPVTASVQQPLPADLTLVSPGGGAVDANGITWQQTVEPHAWVDLSYAVRNDRQDRADIVISGAQLTLYTLETTGAFNFTGAAVTVRSHLKAIYLPLVTRTLPQPVWQNLMTEGFETGFPVAGWRAYDGDGATYGEYFWDDDDYTAAHGMRSAWAARGGANGLDPQYSNYPNNMESWMVYGPFDLSVYKDAELLFNLRNNSEAGYDQLFWGVSLDGANYYGAATSGDSNGWQSTNYDLTSVYQLGDVTGKSQVWIAFVFQSDGSITSTGPFIDDVVLRASTIPMTAAAADVSPVQGAPVMLERGARLPTVGRK